MENKILLHLAIIIFLSKILSSISRKFKIPPVIGMLLLGIVLGRSFLKFIEPDVIINWIAEVGVLFLLFEAGLETNLSQIRKDAKQALLPALGGVIIPFALGFGFMHFLGRATNESLVAGLILTATSVSVSVMTLISMGKLKSLEGRTIINAAIIDDIIGIFLLTLIFSFASSSGGGGKEIMFFLLKMGLFFLTIALIGIYFIKTFFSNLKKLLMENSVLSISIGILLFFAWFAEFSGLASITGAYFAGLFLGQTNYKRTISEGTKNIGSSFFVDVFFVSIGLGFNIFKIDASAIFLIGFLLLAIGGKIFGSWLGSRFSGLDNVRSFRIGSGMAPRGEVALIIANMALDKGIVGADIVSATIVMVILSALVTPFLLKYSFMKLGGKSF